MINIITGFNLQSREYVNLKAGPYESVSDALSSLPSQVRSVGMEVNIVLNPVRDDDGFIIGGNLHRYIFDGGILDSNLIEIGTVENTPWINSLTNPYVPYFNGSSFLDSPISIINNDVKIGSSSERTHNLDVNGSIIARYGTNISYPNDSIGYIQLYVLKNGNSAIGRVLPYTGSSYIDLALGDWNAGNPNIMLKRGGNVGISEGTPTATLDVNGTTRIRGTLRLDTITNISGDLLTIKNGIVHSRSVDDIKLDLNLSDYQLTSYKNIAGGYAGLDNNGLLDYRQLPPLAISSTHVVSSEEDQLNLTVQEGDIAVRTDENISYIALNSSNSSMSDWQQLLTPADNYVTGISWDPSTGILKLNRASSSTLQTSLDGRYDNYGHWDLKTNGTLRKHVGSGDFVDFKDGSNVSIAYNADGDVTINAVDTTYNDFTRTVHGLVPYPGGNTVTRYLREDGTWSNSVDILNLHDLDFLSYSHTQYFEVGSTNDITINWEYTQQIDSQTINGSTIDSTLRTKTFTGISTNTTYVIKASNLYKTISVELSVEFRYKMYYGTSSKTSLTNADILALSSRWANPEMDRTKFDCTGGKYMYFATPVELASNVVFLVGDVEDTNWEQYNILLTNSSGSQHNYTVFKYNNLLNSPVNVKIGNELSYNNKDWLHVPQRFYEELFAIGY